jgi:hypothetical protein
VQSLIQATESSTGVSLDPATESGAATIMAGVNQYIAALPVTGSASYLNQVVQAQVVAENTIAPLFAQVGAGTTDIGTAVTNETGSALTAQISAATVGSLDLDSPLVEIGNLVEQPVGNGNSSVFQFTVYLTATSPRTQPVAVNYTTQDGSAAAGTDYTAETGTVTWLPGDTAPKTINIPVSATTNYTANKTFGVVLSNAVNADIQSGLDVGDISYTDVATTTVLAAPARGENYGDPVTFTATVTNQDASSDPGLGLVVFYNGQTALGSAPLVNGVGTFTVSNLEGGSDSVTASYQGYQAPGISSDPSASQPAPLTVNAAPQSITFSALADQVYGNANFVLTAMAFSGLQVTYSIVSGPATITGDVVTITGAGEVTVEAEQVSSTDYQAATPITRSFNVAQATLVVTVDNQSMECGGSLPSLNYSISGFVNGDDASVLDQPVQVSTVPPNSDVGDYSIVAAGADSANYSFEYVNGALAITPAPLLISADSVNAVYGGTPVLTASNTGLVNGDTPTSLGTLPALSSSGAAGSPVGNYDISATGAVGPNYDIKCADGTLTVTPAPLTFTVDNQTAVYGSTVPTLTGSFSGFVNGDTAKSLTTQPTIGTSATPGSDVGAYDIAASGAVDSNYAITYVDGTLNITPYAFTYQIGNDSQVYGAPATLAADLPSSFQTGVNGGTLEITYASTGDTSNATVGTYAITGTLENGTDNLSNYDVTLVSGTLSVTPRARP